MFCISYHIDPRSVKAANLPDGRFMHTLRSAFHEKTGARRRPFSSNGRDSFFSYASCSDHEKPAHRRVVFS